MAPAVTSIPALAVASELMSRGYRVEWVGTARGLEHRVVPAAGITLHCLPVRGVRGKIVLHKLLGLWFLLLASLQALWLVYPAGTGLCGRHGRLCRRARRGGGLAAAQTTADS